MDMDKDPLKPPFPPEPLQPVVPPPPPPKGPGQRFLYGLVIGAVLGGLVGALEGGALGMMLGSKNQPIQVEVVLWAALIRALQFGSICGVLGGVFQLIFGGKMGKKG